MKRLILTALCAALGVAGCASTVDVYDAGQNQIKGVPFRATEVYFVQGTYLKHTKLGGACTPAKFYETASLPTGAQYYANVKPAQLAKTSFGMTFADSGALAGLTMNTEPAAADTLNAATTALSTLLPFVGLTAAPADGGGAALAAAGAEEPRSSAPACDTGPDDVTYTKLSAR